MQKMEYRGWKNSVRLANGEVELIVTGDVGPRIIRFGFIGRKNIMAEMAGEIGGRGEKIWKIRGGHRLWIAPEKKPLTYELDNVPVKTQAIPGGVRTVQATGSLSRVQKKMDITLSGKSNEVKIVHTLTNKGSKPVELSPWALTVLSPGGMEVIPMPKKIPHTARLTHNQEWSLWGYTDFTDGRWMLGSKYIFFTQNRKRGPGKLGIANREGWVAYLLGEFMFVKRFKFVEGAQYPDGGVNFETFSNEAMLEMETLGPLVKLAPGKSVKHEERWSLFKGIRHCRTERDIDRYVLPLVRRG